MRGCQSIIVIMIDSPGALVTNSVRLFRVAVHLKTKFVMSTTNESCAFQPFDGFI